MSSRAVAVSLCAATLALAAAASAEEVRPQLNPSAILLMLARPVDSPEAALNARVRADAAPRAVRPDEGEVLPDGSVRYGRGNATLTVTVRNPCPPGDFEHEAAHLRSLPGRARR